MNETRNFSPVVWLSLAAGVILLFLLGFAAWFKIPKVNNVFGGLTLLQESHPKPGVLPSSGTNAEGLAIYHQSERSTTAGAQINAVGLEIYHHSERNLSSPRANVQGMAIYHRSERGTTVDIGVNMAGLEIYWQSERGSTVSDPIEQGMAIYLQSERNITLSDPDSSTNEGMDIYHASEWGR